MKHLKREGETMNCNLSIKREKRLGYAAKNIHVYLDGEIISNLGNGKTCSFTITQGKHNIGFAIGKSIVTEIGFQIESGESVDVICWVEAVGGITVRLKDYNIPHNISERNTLGKTANKAVSGTVAVVATLIALGLLSIFIFFLRYM